jgi:Mce-associated membrane protein
MAIDVDIADTQLTALAETDFDHLEVERAAETGERQAGAETTAPQRLSGTRFAAAVSLVTVLTLAGVGGWLGYRAYQAHQAQQQRDMFLEFGRVAALNLTTIDYTEADVDVARIVEAATGTFREDFQKRSPAFIDVITRARSQSQGTITEAGLESDDSDHAQVLIALSVKTQIAGTPQPQPRAWRMRINLQKVGNDIKLSNVTFVP